MVKPLSRFPSVRILVATDDPILRALMREVIAEDAGYDRVTAMALSGDEALDALLGARQPLVAVLAARGDEDMDTPFARLLETAHEANGARPAHRFVVWAWQVPPAIEEFAPATHVRWVLRPSPTEPLLEAVRAAASEIRAA